MSIPTAERVISICRLVFDDSTLVPGDELAGCCTASFDLLVLQAALLDEFGFDVPVEAMLDAYHLADIVALVLQVSRP